MHLTSLLVLMDKKCDRETRTICSVSRWPLDPNIKWSNCLCIICVKSVTIIANQAPNQGFNIYALHPLSFQLPVAAALCLWHQCWSCPLYQSLSGQITQVYFFTVIIGTGMIFVCVWSLRGRRLRIAEGTCKSAIFRWTPVSLTLITVHNQRHHFILNLAEQSIFSRMKECRALRLFH